MISPRTSSTEPIKIVSVQRTGCGNFAKKFLIFSNVGAFS